MRASAQASDRHLPGLDSGWPGDRMAPLAGTVAVAVAASYVGAAVLDSRTVDWLCAEDHVVESLGAVCFLSAAVLFAASARAVHRAERRAGTSGRRVFPAVLLACGLLWLALEEISYGQRMLGFATPEILAGLNTKREFNIHNLRILSSEQGMSHWFNAQRLFSVFWLAYCTLFPVVHRLMAWPRALGRAVYLPVAPVTLGATFLFNYAAAKGMVLFVVPPALMSAVTELKEANYAVLFACFGLFEFARRRREVGAARF